MKIKAIHTENYKYDSFKQIVTEEDLRNPLFYRTIIEGTSWYGQNFECNKAYKAKYENYCYQYAHKYLDVNKFKDFTDQF